MSRNLALTGLVVVLVVQPGGSGIALALEGIAVLTPADAPDGGIGFGWSVAIDGAYVAVGAPADQDSPETWRGGVGAGAQGFACGYHPRATCRPQGQAAGPVNG